jgi:hypothetical protein
MCDGPAQGMWKEETRQGIMALPEVMFARLAIAKHLCLLADSTRL